MRATVIYNSKVGPRNESLITLEKYIQLGRLKSGQWIFVGDLKGEKSTNTRGIWIGDATPFHEPSFSDGGFGWQPQNPILKKYVLEVHEHDY